MDDMILYAENSKESKKKEKQKKRKKTLKTNNWIQQGHRIQDQQMKGNCILYSSHKHLDTENKNTIPFTIPLKTVRTCLTVNLTKHIQDLLAENYEKLTTKIKEVTNN